MRTCNRCNITKSIEGFRTYKVKGKIYRRRVCSECMDYAAVEWRNANKERFEKYSKEYYQKNREINIQRAKEWNSQNSEKKKRNADSSYSKLRHAAIMAYGGYTCSCCGETEKKFLSIDHVNNDGHLNRRGKGHRFTGDSMYRWLKANDYPEGFQVLCFNCNIGKHLNGGVCPHQVNNVQRLSEME